MVLALLVGMPAAGQAAPGGLRMWHGTPIQSLDTPSAFTTAAGTPSSSLPSSGVTSPQPGPATIRLSDERTSTQWANPLYRALIYARPDGAAPRVGHLHLDTEDGFPEVYLLLQQHIDGHNQSWIKLRIPGRPNGRTGWVRRRALGPLELSRWLLVVNRRTERLTAYKDGRVQLVTPVGVGKPGTPTPAGHFWIRERFRVLDPSSPYWPDAMGTSDYSTLSEWPGGGVVGMHGAWDQPQLIPGRPSHGCIRLHNPNIAWLAPRVPVGTPLHVI